MKEASSARIVVAGATGYLGGHLVSELARRGVQVRALARDPARLGAVERDCAEVFVGEATKAESLEGLFDGVDAAFSSIGIRHLRRRPTYQAVDRDANLNLARAAERAGVRRYCFVSVLDGQRARRISPLVEAREQVVEYLQGSRMQSVILRPTGFFNDMRDYLRMVNAGRAWLIGEGKTHINPISGRDLAKLAADALLAPAPSRELSVGGPRVFSQREIAELAFSLAGKEAKFRRVPTWLIRFLAQTIRPFNGNAAAVALVFSLLGEYDAVGECRGSDELEDFFRDVLASSAS